MRTPLTARKLAALTLVAVAGAALATSSEVSALPRGVQVSPDAKRIFVNKDVGPQQRWAITLNQDDGTVTGNVFFRDGSDPSFIVCEPTGAADQFTCRGANSCVGADTQGPARGIQASPDGKRIFVNKDVGADQRWAIAVNQDDGTVTGNVFFLDGRDPSFIACNPTAEAGVLSCLGAGSCRTGDCAGQYESIGDQVTVPPGFFTLPAERALCTAQYTAIGDGPVTVPDGFFDLPTPAEAQALDAFEASDDVTGVLEIGLAVLPEGAPEAAAGAASSAGPQGGPPAEPCPIGGAITLEAGGVRYDECRVGRIVCSGTGTLTASAFAPTLDCTDVARNEPFELAAVVNVTTTASGRTLAGSATATREETLAFGLVYDDLSLEKTEVGSPTDGQILLQGGTFFGGLFDEYQISFPGRDPETQQDDPRFAKIVARKGLFIFVFDLNLETGRLTSR